MQVAGWLQEIQLAFFSHQNKLGIKRTTTRFLTLCTRFDLSDGFDFVHILSPHTQPNTTSIEIDVDEIYKKKKNNKTKRIEEEEEEKKQFTSNFLLRNMVNKLLMLNSNEKCKLHVYREDFIRMRARVCVYVCLCVSDRLRSA